ncbi:MAG: DinB family protein [Chloroflexi bacterium]|nr:DinB family protein [Chloroflexota bacterium]
MPRIPDAHADSYERFMRGPALLREALAGTDPATLNRRPPGEDWSMRDVVIHLADSELVAAVRIRLLLAGDEPVLPIYDPDVWKRKLLYVFRDPEAAMSAFQQVRYGAAELLRECSPEAWERAGTHPQVGVVTVADLVLRGADHVDEHVAQLQAMRGNAG